MCRINGIIISGFFSVFFSGGFSGSFSDSFRFLLRFSFGCFFSFHFRFLFNLLGFPSRFLLRFLFRFHFNLLGFPSRFLLSPLGLKERLVEQELGFSARFSSPSGAFFSFFGGGVTRSSGTSLESSSCRLGLGGW